MEDAKGRRLAYIIGGDFNAEIGERQPGEDERVLGRHGRGPRNGRGEAMAKWAWMKSMAVTSTMFAKRKSKQWTHIQKGRQRTIDYLLVERDNRNAVQDVEVWRRLNLGSDHRAVRMTLTRKNS